MRNRIHLKHKLASNDEMQDLYLLEGLPMITSEMISQLIAKGWRSDLLKQIRLLACCEHGKIAAYYSEKRDAILVPDDIEGVGVTYEITNSLIKMHVFHFQ